MPSVRHLLAYALAPVLLLTSTAALCQQQAAPAMVTRAHALSDRNVRVKEHDGTLVEGKLSSFDATGFLVQQRYGLGGVHVNFTDVENIGASHRFFTGTLGGILLTGLLVLAGLMIAGAVIASR